VTRPPSFEHDLERALAELSSLGLLRVAPGPEGAPTERARVRLCSNDYLGLASLPLEAASREVPAGAGASRLVSGDGPWHREAERALAAWVGLPAALLFTSGYAANVGALSALAMRGDLVISDALNHASIIDGCRLSGADVAVVPHADTAAVREALVRGRGHARRFVVTESYFSMDGDSPDLSALRELTLEHDAALVLDEAHALGVLGPEGRGLAAAAGVVPDVLVGTLGKAMGLQGAFVAGSERLRAWLWNRSRSFVFSTGLSPALAAVVPSRVERVRGAHAERAHVQAVAARLRAGLGALDGARVPASVGPIVPWLVGEPERAVALSRALLTRGAHVQAIRPPTVPPGTSRLRFTVTASTSADDVELVVGALRELAGP
jgi:8-amino-7-oxononanoate synthase